MKTIDIFLAANNTTIQDMKAKHRVSKSRLLALNNQENLTRYKLLVTLINLGYVIPWHIRPKCKKCQDRYIPSTYRNFYCLMCKPYQEQKLSLTPSDCLELGMCEKNALQVLGFPATEEYMNMYASNKLESLG